MVAQFTLREERRLTVLENKVLRRMFGPKRDEVTEDWRKINKEELTQYYSGDKIEKNEMGGACSAYGGGKTYTGFWWANLKDRDYLGYTGVDGSIILR